MADLLNINVKKTTIYIHVNGDRCSHIKNSKNKKSYFTITLHIVDVLQHNKMFLKNIFAVFDVRTSVAVKMLLYVASSNMLASLLRYVGIVRWPCQHARSV